MTAAPSFAALQRRAPPVGLGLPLCRLRSRQRSAPRGSPPVPRREPFLCRRSQYTLDVSSHRRVAAHLAHAEYLAQQRQEQERLLVARTARPSGRVAALSGLERHGCTGLRCYRCLRVLRIRLVVKRNALSAAASRRFKTYEYKLSEAPQGFVASR